MSAEYSVGEIHKAAVEDYVSERVLKMLLALAERIKADEAKAPAAWQYRYKNDRMQWSKWIEWALEEHPEDPFPKMIGRWEVEYRKLFTDPPAQAAPARRDLDVIRQAIEERDAAMQACDDMALRMVYKGNSVGWWHSKATAYRAAIEECWKALGELGIRADGKTHVADVIRTLTAPTHPPAQAAQVDADRIAEETMQAWGDRVPKYSFDFRGLIADGIRRAGIATGSGTL